MSATIYEILQPVEDKVKLEYSTRFINSVFWDIDGLISELNGGGDEISKLFEHYTSQELSIYGGKLSILRSSLIGIQEQAMTNCKRIEARIRLMIPTIRQTVASDLANKNDKKPTQSDIETYTERNIASLKYELWLHETFLESVRSRWYWIPDILYRIETRIKILEGDRTTTNFQ